MNRRTLALPVIFLLSAGEIAARLDPGVIPGRWEKVDALKPGARLTVILKAGETIDGTLLGADSAHLNIKQQGSSAERLIRKADVARITADRWVSDSALDGTLIGMGVGIGLFAAAGAGLCIFCTSGDKAGSAVIFGAIGAGLGAAVGFGLDKARKNPQWQVELLYEAQRP